MYTKWYRGGGWCDIMKWTTGVGVIGTRWVDTGENTQNCQILVRGTPKLKKIGECTECDT